MIRYKANGLISIHYHKGVSHDQMPVAARFENADLRSASSRCDTAKIQLFCPNLLHNVANALGHNTNITNDRSSAKWLPVPLHTGVIPPNFRQLSILPSDLYHDVRDCYCCLLFHANCSLSLSTCAYGNDYILCKPLQG